MTSTSAHTDTDHVASAYRYSHSLPPGSTRADIQQEEARKRNTQPPDIQQLQGTFATQEYIQAAISQIHTERERWRGEESGARRCPGAAAACPKDSPWIESPPHSFHSCVCACSLFSSPLLQFTLLPPFLSLLPVLPLCPPLFGCMNFFVSCCWTSIPSSYSWGRSAIGTHAPRCAQQRIGSSYVRHMEASNRRSALQ